MLLDYVGRFFAFLGAAGILSALAFVTLLIGVLVNAMAALMSGPIIDKFVKDKN